MADKPVRGPSTFRQRDLAAAMKAAKAAGFTHFRVEIDRAGTIAVFVAPDAEAAPEENPWDRVLG